MTGKRLPPAMRPVRPGARPATLPARMLLFGVTLVALVLATAPTGDAHADGGDQHGHIDITLGDVAGTTPIEPDNLLRITLETSRTVEVVDGKSRITVTLPATGRLVSFGPTGQEDAGTAIEQPGPDDVRGALFEWSENGPADGTTVDNVTLVVERTVALEEAIDFSWDPIRIDEVTARVEVPDHFLVVSGRDLVEQAHAPADRRVYSQSVDLPADRLDFQILPVASVPDPAFAAPPNPLAGFFVLIGIGLLSGGAYVLGKKLDRAAGDA